MEQPDSLTRAIKGLTVAVWCLVALFLAQFAFWAWSYFNPKSFFNRTELESTSPLTSARSISSVEDNDFHAFPAAEKVKRATIILITKYVRKEGEVKSVITEIVKKHPGTRFYYSVGDDYDELSNFPHDDEVHGDGQVVFLTGNPASMREAYSYSEGRLGGLGRMTIEKLREMAKQSQ